MFDDNFNLYWNEKNRFLLNDKKQRTRDLVLYMLDRTQQLFVWEGLPETIPVHNLEMFLQTCGNVCITDVPEKGLYAFFGGLGGELNAYYEPTIYTIANPYLDFTAQLEIDKECVRMRNDRNGLGLLPMFTKYGAMMNENEISLNMLAIDYRIDNLISADDDRTFESAKAFLDDIIEGQFGAINSSEFFEGIKNEKVSGSTNQIKDLIEYEQYLKASWFNEIGLNSNYNMKRERIVASESEMNDDALIPLVDNMLEWRIKGIEQIKNLYGDKYDLDGLSVKLNPIWDLDKMYVGMIPEDVEETETEDVEETETEETGTDEPETEETETPEGVTEETETEDVTETDEPESSESESEERTEETSEEIEETEDTEETPEDNSERSESVSIEININNTNGGEDNDETID